MTMTLLLGAVLVAAITTIALGPVIKAEATRKLGLTLLVMLLAGSSGIYLLVGAPDAITHDDPRRSDMRAAQQAVADAPNDADAWDQLSALYRQHGFPNEALKATEAALRLEPATATRLGDLAEALMMQFTGDQPPPPILLKTVEDGLTIDPDDARLRFMQARLASLNGEDETATALLTALAQDETAPPLWRQRAFIALPQSARDVTPQRIRAMVDGLAARLEGGNGSAEDWARLANALGVLGEHARAADAWAQLAEMQPEEPAPLLAQARALRQASDASTDGPEIIVLLQQAQQLDPDNFEAGWLLALHHARSGKLDEARQQFDALLATLPADDPNLADLKTLRDAALGETTADAP